MYRIIDLESVSLNDLISKIWNFLLAVSDPKLHEAIWEELGPI